jgi:hypothetical protein
VSPKAQQIAIAEACDWTEIRELDAPYPDGSVAAGVWWQGKSPDGDSDRLLPDYLNDLNVMHEAEMSRVDMEDGRFIMLFREYLHTILGHDGSLAIHATAAQRAEAFLRAIGKWENTQP